MDSLVATFANVSTEQWLIIVGVLLLLWLLTWWLAGRGGRRRAEAAELRASDAEGKLRRTERELTEAKDQTKRLQTSLVTSDDELSSLRKKAAQAESDLQALNDERSALQLSMETRDGEMRDQSVEMQSEIERLSQGAAAELQVVKANLESVSAERAALAESSAAIQADLDHTRAEYDVANAELARLRDRSDAVEKTIAGKDTALSEAYQRAVVLQRQLQQREEQMSAAEGELEVLRGEVARLSHLQEDMERRLERSRADVAGELATLTSTMIKMKESALNDANARVAQLEAELAASRAGK